jgi:hypothetical protein
MRQLLQRLALAKWAQAFCFYSCAISCPTPRPICGPVTNVALKKYRGVTIACTLPEVDLAFPLHELWQETGYNGRVKGHFRTTITQQRKIMSTDTKVLTREEILALAQQARLMLVDGDVCYLNDMATERELISLVRLVESALVKQMASSVKD